MKWSKKTCVEKPWASYATAPVRCARGGFDVRPRAFAARGILEVRPRPFAARGELPSGRTSSLHQVSFGLHDDELGTWDDPRCNRYVCACLAGVEAAGAGLPVLAAGRSHQEDVYGHLSHTRR